MPIHILLILVVGGISIVALLLHKLGKSRLTILNPQSARIAWLRHFPEDQVSTVTVTQDGHTAFLDTSQGPGLLWSFGADTVGRLLQNYKVREAPDHLKVVFADFSAPRVTVRLNGDERALWHKKLAPT